MTSAGRQLAKRWVVRSTGTPGFSGPTGGAPLTATPLPGSTGLDAAQSDDDSIMRVARWDGQQRQPTGRPQRRRQRDPRRAGTNPAAPRYAQPPTGQSAPAIPDAVAATPSIPVASGRRDTNRTVPTLCHGHPGITAGCHPASGGGEPSDTGDTRRDVTGRVRDAACCRPAGDDRPAATPARRPGARLGPSDRRAGRQGDDRDAGPAAAAGRHRPHPPRRPHQLHPRRAVVDACAVAQGAAAERSPPVTLELIDEGVQPRHDGITTDGPHVSGLGLLSIKPAVTAPRPPPDGTGFLLPTSCEARPCQLVVGERRLGALAEAGPALKQPPSGRVMQIDRDALVGGGSARRRCFRLSARRCGRFLRADAGRGDGRAARAQRPRLPQAVVEQRGHARARQPAAARGGAGRGRRGGGGGAAPGDHRPWHRSCRADRNCARRDRAGRPALAAAPGRADPRRNPGLGRSRPRSAPAAKPPGSRARGCPPGWSSPRPRTGDQRLADPERAGSGPDPEDGPGEAADAGRPWPVRLSKQAGLAARRDRDLVVEGAHRGHRRPGGT